MNTRRKGQRNVYKALRFAKSLCPKAYVMPIYQSSRFATPQPCDLIIFEYDRAPILVEVRSNQWGVAKSQTRLLAHLPSLAERQIWLFQNGHQIPRVRIWNGEMWQEILCEALAETPVNME